MRKSLVNALLKREDDNFCVMTGDLGYRLLEPLRDALGERFVNAGIAEQNMISTAAGIARTGMEVYVYSIAPFCYARAFESIRLDVALHNLPVHILGAGGGYAYGVQGPTHHALEDTSAMSSLQNLKFYAPCFASDVEALVACKGPTYFRLTNDSMGKDFPAPAYAPFRALLTGRRGVVFALGDLAQGYYRALAPLAESERPTLCACATLPVIFAELPEPVRGQLAAGEPVWVFEENVRSGGLGASLAEALLENHCAPAHFEHHAAAGYPTPYYGDRAYYCRVSGLDADSMLDAVRNAGKN